MVQNKAFIYKSIPHGWPKPNQDLAIEDIGFDDNASPPKNGITTKNLYAAFDPSQRGRMRDPSVQSYSPAMEPGKPVISVSVIGKVLKSDNANIKEGQTVMLQSAGTETYSRVEEGALKNVQIIEEKDGVPLTSYLGLLGMTGMTAYGSLHEIGQPKEGDVILISAAAGAVGQMVAQIAVREGLYVIGSAGDDEKIKFLKEELGVQAAFNYKKENAWDAVKRLAPDGIDIFYDNVGGEQLDCALANMKVFGRIGRSSSSGSALTGSYFLLNVMLTYLSGLRRNLTIQQCFSRRSIRHQELHVHDPQTPHMEGLPGLRPFHRQAPKGPR